MVRRQRRARLIVGALLLGLLAGGAGADEGSPRRFTIAGLALGMDAKSVLQVLPGAEAADVVAYCYSYGRAVVMPALTRRTMRHRDGAGALSLSFASAGSGGRLSRIRYDRPGDASAAGIRELLAALSARYGPPDRILYRRKMEPAGRIVGYEWRGHDGAVLRVVLRRDRGGDGVRLSFLASSAKPTSPRPAGPRACRER